MTFYESIANQGMFIETSGECAMYFGQEARCVTDTSQLFHLFGEEEAQMFKKSTVFIMHFALSLHFTLSLQSVFYTQS